MEAARANLSGFGGGLHSGIVAPYILHYGSEEQKQRWLPKMATGELIGAIAMTEPGTGSDLQAIRTTAKRATDAQGDHYVLNGQKTFITNGGNANLIIVACRTGGEGSKGMSLVVVETEHAQGFRRGRLLDKIGMKAQDTAELFFDEVRVPAHNLLGAAEGQGFVQLMQQLPQERLIVALGGIAAMERALAETLAYVKRRRRAEAEQRDHSAELRIVDVFQSAQYVGVVHRTFPRWPLSQRKASCAGAISVQAKRNALLC